MHPEITKRHVSGGRPHDRAGQSMSGSPRSYRSGNGESLLAGINDEAPPAQKTDQRQSQFARELNRETRRRGYRRQKRDSGGDRFLDDLESAAAAHEKHM